MHLPRLSSSGIVNIITFAPGFDIRLVKKLLLWLLVSSFAVLNASGQTYNFYYGNLHAHSGYSDGNQDSVTSAHSTPAQDYDYAKQSFHMDFLGISDHNHIQAGMQTPGDYHSGVNQATAANTDGTFVSLYGMEWGVISGGGHVLVYGMDSLTGWDVESNGTTPDYDIFCAKNDYSSLWNIVNAHAGAFCTLAHPNSTDFSNLTGGAFSSAANLAISGCAFRSGSAFSTTTNYTDPAPTSYETYYKQLLAKGYHAAPQVDADNHNTTFGRTHKGRTVVLAPSLSRSNILSALKNRRYYASDDWNAQVVFTVGGSYMGSSILLTSNTVINVSVSDPDAGDNVSGIQILYGIPGSGILPAVLTSNSASSTLNYTHTTSVGNSFYYYARITQADGDIINTAPVWVTRTSVVLPIEGLVLTGEEKDKISLLKWDTQTEIDNNYFVVEKSYNGVDFFPIGYINSQYHNSTIACHYTFMDSNSIDGTQFYRLQQVDMNGTNKYSSTVAVTIHKPVLELLSLFPNPVQDELHLRFNSAIAGTARCHVFDAEGRQVMISQVNFNKGINEIACDEGRLSHGLYYLVLSQPDKRILETSFVKE